MKPFFDTTELVIHVAVCTYDGFREEWVVESIDSEFEALALGQSPIVQLAYFNKTFFNNSACYVSGYFNTASILLKIKKFQ